MYIYLYIYMYIYIYIINIYIYIIFIYIYIQAKQECPRILWVLFKVPSSPNHLMILWFLFLTFFITSM